MSDPPAPTLLAVDMGLHTGLALYGRDGRLIWYRSHHLGSAEVLRRAAYGLLGGTAGLERLVVEGGGPLAEIWLKEAQRRQLTARQIGAETWRAVLLYDREQRSGPKAKQHAETLARAVIVWSGAPRPKALRHDTAEAILIGLWGVLDAGWLAQPPPELRR